MSESNSAKKRRVSKRRSSFAAGRAKLQQSGAYGGDLYKSIDPDKPPDERLALLTKACLQYTLQKMEEESTDIESFQPLKKELEEAALHQIAEMEETGVFKKATESRRCLPNPINLEMDQTIIEVEDRIKRLDDEMVAWDELLNRLDREADEFQKKERNVTEADIPLYVKKLGEEWMVPKMDYSSMLSDLDKDMKVTKFHINNFCRATKTLQRTCFTAGKILNTQIPKLQKEVFQETASADTPRKMIEKITTLPS